MPSPGRARSGLAVDMQLLQEEDPVIGEVLRF